MKKGRTLIDLKRQYSLYPCLDLVAYAGDFNQARHIGIMSKYAIKELYSIYGSIQMLKRLYKLYNRSVKYHINMATLSDVFPHDIAEYILSFIPMRSVVDISIN